MLLKCPENRALTHIRYENKRETKLVSWLTSKSMQTRSACINAYLIEQKVKSLEFQAGFRRRLMIHIKRPISKLASGFIDYFFTMCQKVGNYR